MLKVMCECRNESGHSDPSGVRRLVLVSRIWWCQVSACVPPLLTSLVYTRGVRAVFINSGLDTTTHLSNVLILLVSIFFVQLSELQDFIW